MRLALLFPGQGSQSVGMLRELAAVHPAVGETFAEASGVLGYDLWALVQEGPESVLNETERTQPAMLAAGVATWRVWVALGGAEAASVAGHSLGEYTALVCAGALGFPEAVALVADRGRFMQEAVAQGQGAMAAILGLTDAQIEELCEAVAQGEVVAPANYNSPGQVVVAGTAEAVRRLVTAAKAAGARRAVTLPVSVPSHCALMDPASLRLAERLAEVAITSPRVPVIHNVDARSRAEPAAIRAALVDQLHRPVRWVECVRRMEEEGVQMLVEAGPGRVLSGLAKRIAPAVPCASLSDPEGLRGALAQLAG
jgi:[acyl-carrier-protein] S-malonyltransferase